MRTIVGNLIHSFAAGGLATLTIRTPSGNATAYVGSGSEGRRLLEAFRDLAATAGPDSQILWQLDDVGCVVAVGDAADFTQCQQCGNLFEASASGEICSSCEDEVDEIADRDGARDQYDTLDEMLSDREARDHN